MLGASLGVLTKTQESQSTLEVDKFIAIVPTHISDLTGLVVLISLEGGFCTKKLHIWDIMDVSSLERVSLHWGAAL